MDVGGLAVDLVTEAAATDERRLLVLAGPPQLGFAAAEQALEAAPIERTHITVVGDETPLAVEHVPPAQATELLGTTCDAIVLDCHDGIRPNVIGQTVGTVRGGGLYVLVTPDLGEWLTSDDAIDERHVVPPYAREDVTSMFTRRLVDTLWDHRGVAIVDVAENRIVTDGLTDPAPVRHSTSGQSNRPPHHSEPVEPDGQLGSQGAVTTETQGEQPAATQSTDSTFPAGVYERCLTGDQQRALRGLEAIFDPMTAIVLEADRGRGKSSVVGLAAGAIAHAGFDVAITGPQFSATREALCRATELAALFEPEPEMGACTGDNEDSTAPSCGNPTDDIAQATHVTDPSQVVHVPGGGVIRYVPPEDIESVSAAMLMVDEAAGLPVDSLWAALGTDRVVYATTIHGYEGAGRGFSVRFRDHLAASAHDDETITLTDPIRYAAGDPVEVWAFDALALDARPAVDQVVAGTEPADTSYEALAAPDLCDDRRLLSEAFGLLVQAHYRTEPDDLSRLLDAPNVATRALVADGHVVAVALLAREGGLDAATRERAYDGMRIRGNMIPDLLMSQLRDEAAGKPVGVRVLRIATHPAVRSQGLGSRLLDHIRTEVMDGLSSLIPPPSAAQQATDADEPPAITADWLGVSFAATPDLLSFWRQSGFHTVDFSRTRNDRSGRHSAIMFDPLTEAGTGLTARTTRRFVRRLPGLCHDTLATLDPDVLRGTLRAIDGAHVPAPALSDWEWSVVASAVYGPGQFDVAPTPFAHLAVAYFADHPDPDAAPLSPPEERLLITRVLQSRDWETTATELGYHSTRECMLAIGDAFRPIVEQYGGDVVDECRTRYQE